MPIFKNIVDKILQKTPLTITSVTNVRNEALRNCMLEELSQKRYSDESILATPFYETIFPWQGDSCTLEKRCEKHEINPVLMNLHCKTLSNGKVIDSLYLHQRRAIEAIRKGKSIVVTTGTGSGKTECFMYPIFDYLANKLDCGEKLNGVQALFLYPLNALIQSQGDRFERFCKIFNEKYSENAVHYANYTGKMKDLYSEAIAELQRVNPTLSKTELEEKFPKDGVEYIDRETLRSSVPQFLITNSAMLEYALIRKADNPLFEKSDLKFVVLDEAHSYTGSNATELAMRLRRVLLAFGKKPSEVQFIMTSATVGNENDVRKFLADLTDVGVENVECISGKRVVPELPQVQGTKYNIETALRELRKSTDEKEQFNILCRTDKAVRLRTQFISGSGRLSQDDLNDYFHLKSPDTIDFLDFASSAKNEAGEFFLPLKMHVFQKHFPGVWACCNPECTGKQKSLQGASSDWKYGRVYFDINDVDKVTDENGNSVGLKTCSYCKHNIMQVVSCHVCGEIYLAGQAEWDNEQRPHNMIVRIPKVVDEIDQEDDDADDEVSVGGTQCSAEKVLPVLMHWIPDGSTDYRVEWLEYLKEDDSRACLCPDDKKIKDMGLITYLECQTGHGRCHNCSMPLHVSNAMNANGTFPMGKGTNINGFGISPKVLYSSLVKDVLLEDAEIDKDLPTGGRKLLGFTDSRQGTAYYAGMQGIVAEMAATRVWILNYLFKNEPYSRDRLILKIEKGIKKIGLERFHLPEDLRNKKAKDLAKLFLWREITFRNRRKRSLETLGLMQVKYMGLENIDRPTDELKDYFASDIDYRDALKVVLDYGFRKIGALTLDGWSDLKEIRRVYAGTAIYIEAFDLSYFDPNQKPSRLNGIANILRYYINPNVGDKDITDVEWADICRLMKKIVEDLENVDIIAEETSGSAQYKINWESVELSLPSKIWMCPSTKTLLDVVIYNCRSGEFFSPYIVSIADWNQRLPISRDSVEDLSSVWNSSDKREAFVQKFKDRIWWTDLHQDVLSSLDDNDAFVVSQEDTAQISSIQRAKDQEDFKQGKINILNCSTTMEMGVDIGDVSLVSMTNVPPHEYNYVQRAGRAGRAGQGQSFIWTMSSFGGHERKAVKNPLQWVEKNTLKQKLNLENQRIVQRHFNSYLLANWIRTQDDFKIDFEKRVCEFFIGNVDPDWQLLLNFILGANNGIKVLSIEDFISALEAAMAKSPMSAFIKSIYTIDVDDSLMARTGCSKDVLMRNADSEWKLVYENWKDNVVDYYSVITEELDVGSYVEYADISLKNRAVLRHLRKELNSYGLQYLIKKGILPSNGMPIDVVALETFDEDDENEYPSRERKIAIREFAPGYSLIVNGERLMSRGVSLQPLSRKQTGDTLIRSYYTCMNCGTPYISGIDTVEKENEIRCSCCNSVIGGTPRKIIEPIGFKVLGSDRNLEYVPKPPFEQPHIKLLENAKSVVYNENVSFKYGPSIIVYLNGNTKARNENRAVNMGGGLRPRNPVPADSADDGYCLCLNCGFTALSRDGMKIDIENNGWGGAEKTAHRVYAEAARKTGCQPEHYRMVSLAAMSRTDAVLIHIKQIKDPVSANTWALALRNALTSQLALNEDEIGWTSQKGLDGVYDIVLYDNASGGANLCTKIQDNMLIVFKTARSLLECPSHCDSICLDCLLTRETQVMAHVLNRNTALNKLDEKFFAGLSIQDNLKFWGDDTQFWPNFFERSQEIIEDNSKYSLIKFFLTGNEDVATFSDWPLKYDVEKNREKIRFVVSDATWEKAKRDSYLKALMLRIFQITGQLNTVSELPFVGVSNDNVFMETTLHEESCGYVVKDLVFDDTNTLMENLWREPQRLSVFSGKNPTTEIKNRDLQELFANGLNARSMLIPEGTKYTIDELAAKLFNPFKEDDLLLAKKVKCLEFSDRYLFTPSAIRFVCEMLKYFDPEEVHVITARKNDGKMKSRDVDNAWSCDYSSWHIEILDKVLRRALPSANVVDVCSGKTPHDRTMRLTYDDGESRLIQFTGSPTIWVITDANAPKPSTIRTTALDIDADAESGKIMSVAGTCHAELRESTSIIVSK